FAVELFPRVTRTTQRFDGLSKTRTSIPASNARFLSFPLSRANVLIAPGSSGLFARRHDRVSHRRGRHARSRTEIRCRRRKFAAILEWNDSPALTSGTRQQRLPRIKANLLF